MHSESGSLWVNSIQTHSLFSRPVSDFDGIWHGWGCTRETTCETHTNFRVGIKHGVWRMANGEWRMGSGFWRQSPPRKGCRASIKLNYFNAILSLPPAIRHSSCFIPTVIFGSFRSFLVEREHFKYLMDFTGVSDPEVQYWS
jgi:hypothetical protein